MAEVALLGSLTGPEIYGRYEEVPHSKVFDRPMTGRELSAAREGREEIEFIYFISAPAVNVIKIGYSASYPSTRLGGLRGSSPCPLVPLGFIRGDRLYERALHAAFEPIRSHCEWFRAEPALLDFVDRFALPWETPIRETVWLSREHAYDRYSTMFDVIDDWAVKRFGSEPQPR